MDDLDSGKGAPLSFCTHLTNTKMSRSKQIQITLVPVRSRKSKSEVQMEQNVAQFERRLLDLIADPTSQYLTARESFTRALVKALHEVQLGLVIS